MTALAAPIVGRPGHHQPTGTTTHVHHGGPGQGPDSPAAPPAGTLHPRADRPVACWTGCHLAAARLKGAAVLAALRSSRPYGTASGGP
jgi:hypothetical protein